MGEGRNMKKVADYRWMDVTEKQEAEEPAYALMERIANLVDMLHDVTAANVALVEQTRELLRQSGTRQIDRDFSLPVRG